MESVFLVILLPVIDFLPKYELLTAEGRPMGREGDEDTQAVPVEERVTLELPD